MNNPRPTLTSMSHAEKQTSSSCAASSSSSSSSALSSSSYPVSTRHKGSDDTVSDFQLTSVDDWEDSFEGITEEAMPEALNLEGLRQLVLGYWGFDFNKEERS